MSKFLGIIRDVDSIPGKEVVETGLQINLYTSLGRVELIAMPCALNLLSTKRLRDLLNQAIEDMQLQCLCAGLASGNSHFCPVHSSGVAGALP